jgi:hypothetical protein
MTTRSSNLFRNLEKRFLQINTLQRNIHVPNFWMWKIVKGLFTRKNDTRHRLETILSFSCDGNLNSKSRQNLGLIEVDDFLEIIAPYLAGKFRPILGRCYDHNFGDFCHFSAKTLAIFSKTNVIIKILHNLPLIWVKNANFFAEFFGENI